MKVSTSNGRSARMQVRDVSAFGRTFQRGSRARLLSTAALLATGFSPSIAAADCATDPASPTGAQVVCVASDTDGFSSGADNLRVTVVADAIVSAPPARSSVFQLTGVAPLLVNDGIVDGGAIGPNGAAVSGTRVLFNVRNRGLITSAGSPAISGGNIPSGLELFNTGTIRTTGASAAILLSGGRIDNRGLVEGGGGAQPLIAFRNVALPVEVVNTGTIRANGQAINGSALFGRVVFGGNDATAAESAVEVTNFGAITGDVVLGPGRDVYRTNDAAALTGDLDLGAGDDQLLIRLTDLAAPAAPRVTGTITPGAGYDVILTDVRATRALELPDFGFERRDVTTGVDRPTITLNGPNGALSGPLRLLGDGVYVTVGSVTNVVVDANSVNRGIGIDLDRTRQDGQDIGSSPTLINNGTIAVASTRPFSDELTGRDQAVRLDNFTRFTNAGTLTATGVNAVGISINGDNRENGGSAFNSGTITLAGQATGAFVNGGSLENSGAITGDGDGVELRAATAATPLFTNTATGRVEVSRSAVLLRDSVPYLLNEGQLISTGRAAVESVAGVGDRPVGALIVNRGDGLIRGAAGTAILGADGAETIRNQGAGRIEGSIQLGGARDRVANAGTIVGDVLTGADGDTVNNSGTVQGSVLTGAGGDYFQWQGGTVSGVLALGTEDDALDIGGARTFNAAAIAAGGIDAGGQTSDARRDVVSLTSVAPETFDLFATPTSFEGIRLFLENTPGGSTIANQATPYTSGFVWIAGRGTIASALDITRAADPGAVINPGIIIDTFRYTPDVGDAVAPGINFTNTGTIRAIGTGITGGAFTAGLRVDIASDTAFTGENAGTIRAEGVGATGVSMRGSDTNFSANSDARFNNSGLIEATGGATGLEFGRFRRADTETRPEPGVFNSGTISAAGAGGVAVTHGNSWFNNLNTITAATGAEAIRIVANSTTVNVGSIASTDAAAIRYLQGDNRLINLGSIVATGAAALQFGTLDTTIGAISVQNLGLIQGAGTAFLGGESGEGIANQAGGRIVGAVLTGGGGDTVTNAGAITGDVVMGAGNDAFTALGGTVSGALDLGAGDDTLLLNAATAAGAGVAGPITAGIGASEIDRVGITVAGTQTLDPRAATVLGGFEILRVDGPRSGETLTLANPGVDVVSKLELALLATDTGARATAINTANFATQNLVALEAFGGRALLADGGVGGTLVNRGAVSLTFTADPAAPRADRVRDLRAFATAITAGVELVNEGTIRASGSIAYQEFGDTVTRVATALGTADTETETGGDRVVAPFVTNRATGLIEGVNGARAVDTDGGAIIRNEGTIRAADVAGNNAAAMDLGNDTITNTGLIEGLGAGTRAISAGSGFVLTNAGTVQAATTAIEIDGGEVELSNTGTIRSTGGESAFLSDGNENRITNSGLIVSDAGPRATMRFLQSFQSTSSSDRNVITNEAAGRIEKIGGGTAIFGGREADADANPDSQGDGSLELVINRGAIVGDLDLGDNTDLFHAVAGTLTGNISMGRDGDVLILADGAITGGVDMGGGEDTVLLTIGSGVVQPTGGVFAGSGVDAAGSLFFASGSVTLQAFDGFEMAAVGAVGYNTTVTLGATGAALPVSIRTLGSGQFINRHDVTATPGRAAIEVEDRDQRIVNEGTLGGVIGIDDGDLALRLENRGTINATRFGIAARGDGVETTVEGRGTFGRPVFNSGAINVFGTNAVGIFNVSSGEGRVRAGSSFGLTSVFPQPDAVSAIDRPELARSVLLSNTGTITVGGAGAIGIHTDRSDAYIENLNTIRVAGDAAIGVLFADDGRTSRSGNVRFANAGLLEVGGAGADGFVSLGQDSSATSPNLLANTGTIRVTGGVIDRSTDYAQAGFVVDNARAVDMALGSIGNSATGVIEATDRTGVAIWSRTSRDEPGANGDDPGTAPRRGTELRIVNDGLISGTDGYYAAVRVTTGPTSDRRFVYENRFIGAIQGGSGTEFIDNRGTIRGAVNLNADGDTVLNFGTIDGDVLLGVGEDTFRIGAGSVVTGTVDGQLGFDLLEVDIAGATSLDASRFVSFERLGLLGAGTLDLTAGRLNFDTVALNGNGLRVGAAASVVGRTGTAVTGGDGAETVFLDGLVEGDIALGGGDDRLVRGGSSVFRGVFDGGAGLDTLEVALTGAAPLDLGGAVNVERLAATGAGTLLINAVANLEQVTLADGSLSVGAGGALSGSVIGGAASQSFVVAGSMGGGIDAGAGDDLVDVTGSVAGDILLGDGQDSFVERGGRVAGLVDGGAGRDTLSVTIDGDGAVDLGRRVNFEVLSKAGAGALLVTQDLRLDGITLVGGSVRVSAGATLDVAALGIAGGAGDQQVVNAGRLVGAVSLGDGADRIETSGVLAGAAALGGGDDLLRLVDGGVVEGLADGGAGLDRIETAGVLDRTLTGGGFTGFELLSQSGPGRLTLAGQWTFQSVALAGDLAIDAGATVTAGEVRGGDGGITLTNRGTLNAPVFFGVGSDRLLLVGAATVGAVDGGAGDDLLSLELAGDRRFDGAAATGFERLDVSGAGRLALDGASTFGTVRLAGVGLDLGAGSALTGSVAGGAGAEQLLVAAGGRIAGAVDLGDGDDAAELFGRVDGAVLLGGGADRLTLDGGSLLNAGARGGADADVLTVGPVGGTLALGGYAEFETLELRGATTLTGAGTFDTVAFNTTALTVAGGASLTTGALNGDATANLLTVNGTVTGAIDLGLGDDTLRLAAGGTLAGGSVGGGAGADTLAIDLAGAVAPYTLNAGGFSSFETLEKTGAQQLVLAGGADFASVRSTGDLRLTGGALAGSIAGAADAANRLLIEGDVGGGISTGGLADTVALSARVAGAVDLGAGDDLLSLTTGGALGGALAGGDGVDRLVVTSDAVTAVSAGVTGVERLEANGAGTLALGGAAAFDAVALNGGALRVAAGGSLAVATGLSGTGGAEQLLVDGTFVGTASLGDGNDTLVNRGRIDGSIDLGGGDDTALQALNATLTGFVDGGAGADNLILEVATQGQANADQFRNFESISQRGGGEFRLTGDLVLDTITLMEGTFTLTEGSTLRSLGQPAIQGMDTAETVNALGLITGDVRLAGGDDTVRLGANGGVNGRIVGGTGTDTLAIEIGERRATGGIDAAEFEIAVATGGTLVVNDAFTVPDLRLGGAGVEITAAGSLAGSLTGGDAAQVLVLSGRIVGSADLGAGDDLVVFDGERLGAAVGPAAGGSLGGVLSGGLGADALRLTAAGPVAIDGAAVTGFERIDALGAGGLLVNGGTVTADVSIAGALTIAGAPGAVATLRGTVTGGDADNALFVGPNGAFAGTATLGVGADTATIAIGTAVFDAALDGGAGEDRLAVLASGTTTLTGRVAGFETVGVAGDGLAVLNTDLSTGSVALTGGADLELGAANTLTVSGAITSDAAGSQLTNRGTIRGAVTLGDGADGLVNRGLIDGPVSLGGGDDTFLQGLTGRLTRTADGGAGSDTLILEVLTQGSADASQFTGFESLSQIGGGSFDLSGDLTLDTLNIAGGTFRLAPNSSLTARSGLAVLGGDGAETVENRGTINGAIDLRGGDDTVANFSVINGALRLGAGDDLVSLAEGATVTGGIDGGAGADRVNVAIAGELDAGGLALTDIETLATTGGRLLVSRDLAVADLALGGEALRIGAGASLSAAVTGSALAQTLELAGTLNGSADLGEGDDLFRLTNVAGLRGTLAGGSGADTLVIEDASGVPLSLDGARLGGIERTILRAGEVTLGGSFGSALLFETTPAAASFTIGAGAALNGSATGDAGAQRLTVAGELTGDALLGDGYDRLAVTGRVGGRIDLGGGDDLLALGDRAVLGRPADGGAGRDTLEVTVATGRTFQLAPTTGFELLGKLGAGELALTGAQAFDRVDLDAGSLSIETGGSLSAVGGVLGSAGAQTLTNAGAIAGAVDLGDGADRFVYLSGSTNARVLGGGGTDTLELRVGAATGGDVLANFAAFEILDKTGAGTLTLSNAVGFSGVDVRGGGLRLDAAARLTAPTVTIGGGATLSGAGAIAGNLVVTGTVSPGFSPGTLSVAGDVTFNAGSTFAVELTREGFDRLAATGAVTIASGATLAITAPDFIDGTFDVLGGGTSLTGAFSTVTSTDFLLVTPIYTANTLRLEVISQLARGAALSTQSRAAADGFNSLLRSGASAEVRDAARQLAAVQRTGVVALDAAFNRLQPEAYASAEQAALSTAQLSVDTLANYRDGGVRSARTSTGLSAWASGLYRSKRLERDEDRGTSRTDLDSYGVIGGVDAGIGETVRVGLYGAYTETDQSFRGLPARTDAESATVGLYATADFGGTRAEVSVGHQWSSVDIRRDIGLNDLTARSSFDIDTWIASARIGHSLSLGGRVALRPVAGLTYLRTDRDAAVESGAQAFNLAVAGRKEDHLVGDLGVQIRPDRDGRFAPYAEIGVRYDLVGDTPLAVARFAGGQGDSFTVAGARETDVQFKGVVGGEYRLTERLRVFGSYQGNYGGGTTNHAANAGVSFRF